ncbi:MAG: PAS domain S-box protein [Desulfobacteraceae bacterium]|nr:MAG: PAS domain S-box protein [Desulfobacteraceae bacterium]
MKKSIGWRLIGYVFLLSSLITLSGTFIELQSEYSMEIQSINGTFDLIENGYLPSLVNSLWIADKDMTNILLLGMRGLPHICNLQIDLTDGIPETSRNSSGKTIERQFPLSFMHENKNVSLGKLHVRASLDDVFERLKARFLVILGTQGAGVFLTSILLYFLFHTLVARHIYTMEAYARALELDELAEPLSLIGKKNRGDELDRLVFSINQMKSTINEEFLRRGGIETALLESEAQLKKANQIMAGILEHTHMMAVLFDSGFNFVWVNRAYSLACKHDPSFFPGKNHFDLYPHKENQSIFQRVVDTGVPYFITAKPFTYPDQPERGTTYWDWSLIPIKDGVGKVTNLVFTLVEVTDRVKAEESVSRSEERHRAILKTAMDGFWLLDTKGHLVEVNDAYCRMSGYSEQELLAMSVSDLVAAENRAGIAAHIQKVVVQGADRFGTRHLRKDGSTLDVEVSVQYRPGSEGHLVVFLRDITERKRVEDALRESELRYRIVADNAYNWEFWIGPDRKVLYMSPSCERISGRTAEEFMADPDLLLEIIDPEDRQRYLMHHHDLIKETEEISIEFRIIRPDGEERWVEHVCQPIFDHAGKPFGRRGSNRDCTQRKRAEEEKAKLQARLIQAQKMEALGTLAGGIAHDFNNSLGAILGFTEMAMIEARGREKLRDYLGNVYKAGERARDLVKEILLFSRQMKTELRPLSMGSVVAETTKLLRPALPSTIKIHLETLTDKDIVLADPTQIHQVILNLCVNAAHSMREKGGVLKILVRCKRIESEAVRQFPHEVKPGMYVELEVADTGHGMENKILPMIFDPFFTTKKPGEGTGMGLAVVHGIVEEHGGSIQVESRVGEGTTFHVFIPCLEGVEPSPQHVVSYRPSKEQGRIIYVDDDEGMAQVGNLMLSKAGYDVVPSTSSPAVLGMFRSGPEHFDAAVVDMTMPGMTGLDLAREMTKIRPGFPVVLATGYSELIDPERLQAAGVQEVLFKPFSLEDLVRALRRARGKNG